MKIRQHSILLIAAILLASTAMPQAPADPWAPLRFLVGSWDGHETGAAGIGRGDRTYEFLFDGKYLLARNVSRFDPQPQNPKGEVHQDWAFFSYDQQRKRIVLREFHSEGFFNQYVLDEAGVANGRFVFDAESLENSPPGWRARVTIMVESKDDFEEIFEMARPGQDLKPLLKNRWTRRTPPAPKK